MLRDIVLGVLAGVVIDATIQALHLEVLFPALPYVWFGILVYLTLDFLKRNKKARDKLVALYDQLNKRQLVLSYVVVGLIGIVVAEGYWVGIKKIFEMRAGKPAPAAPLVTAKPSEPLPNTETQGTTDKVETRPEHHGTTDKATAKLGSAKPKEPEKVLPPKSDVRFHERVDRYLFSLGENGITTDATIERLKKGSTPFQGFPITVFSKIDDDKIHYRIILNNGPMPVEIVDGEFSFNQPYWDRNFNDVALEIVDNNQQPMLQVIWKTPSHLVLNGIFRMQDGSTVIADSNGYRPMKAGDKIKPLFKYPSYKYQGQYAD